MLIALIIAFVIIVFLILFSYIQFLKIGLLNEKFEMLKTEIDDNKIVQDINRTNVLLELENFKIKTAEDFLKIIKFISK